MGQTYAQRRVTNPATTLASGDLIGLSQGGIGTVGTVGALASAIGASVGVKVYRALLTQTGTDTPVATVLENSLGGTVVWSYLDVGFYNALLTGAFVANKTALSIQSASQNANLFTTFSIFRVDVDNLNVRTGYISADPEINSENGDLISTFVQILVYP